MQDECDNGERAMATVCGGRCDAKVELCAAGSVNDDVGLPVVVEDVVEGDDRELQEQGVADSPVGLARGHRSGFLYQIISHACRRRRVKRTEMYAE
jgi:hypothetical protein